MGESCRGTTWVALFFDDESYIHLMSQDCERLLEEILLQDAS